MGLLDQLWDETVAGPRPDHGLGKLRKYSSFSPSSSSAAAAPAADAAPAVTRSITIARPPSLSLPSGESSSVPSSPASAPDSPFAAATSRRDGWRAFRRKSKMANVDVVPAEATVGPRSPTVYDWKMGYTWTKSNAYMERRKEEIKRIKWEAQEPFQSARRRLV